MTNTEIVLQLIDAIERNNKDDILSFFTEDAIFHNMPMEPAVGHIEIWGIFSLLHDDAEAIEWEVHHLAKTEHGWVVTERTDRYKIRGRWLSFHVMGIFELRDGKISHWRDYFDLQQCMNQMQDDE